MNAAMALLFFLAAATPLSLEERWKRAAMFYNSGIYDEAAAAFEEVLREKPEDALTQKYLRQSRNAVSFGTRLNDEAPENRSFQALVSTAPALSPVELLPGIGPRPPATEALPSELMDKPAASAGGAQETPAAPPMPKADKEILYNRGVALLNEGKNEEALRVFEIILQTDPGHAPSRIRAEKAREALRKVKERRPPPGGE